MAASSVPRSVAGAHRSMARCEISPNTGALKLLTYLGVKNLANFNPEQVAYLDSLAKTESVPTNRQNPAHRTAHPYQA